MAWWLYCDSAQDQRGYKRSPGDIVIGFVFSLFRHRRIHRCVYIYTLPCDFDPSSGERGKLQLRLNSTFYSYVRPSANNLLLLYDHLLKLWKLFLNQSSVTKERCPINVEIHYLTCNWKNTNPENPWKWRGKIKLLIYSLLNMSYELVCVSPFTQVYHCNGIKTAQTKTTKNTFDTRGNHQQYTSI